LHFPQHNFHQTHKLFVCESWAYHGIYYEDIATVTLSCPIHTCQHFWWTCSRFLWNVGTTYIQHYTASHPRKLLSLQLCLAITHNKRNSLLCVHTSDEAWTDHHTPQGGTGTYLPILINFVNNNPPKLY
jgi:hypothetical protein